MKTWLFAMFVPVLLTGCEFPETSVRGEPKENSVLVASGTTSDSNVVVALPESFGVLASPTNAPAPPPAPAELDLPESTREVIRLAHQQLGEGVLTNFISTIREPFHLDADQIVYLRDMGVGPTIIEALLIKQQQLDSILETRQDPQPNETPTPKPQIAYASPVPAASTEYPGGTSEAPPPQVEPAITVPQTYPTEIQPVVNNFNFFYDSLAPYGNWVTVPSYGYVWQPSCAVITPGWRPYWNNGSWVWSDSGWFWNSNYSWGWAPFHYGNWFNSPGFGWCWAPGNVWGPSWVTFRYSTGFCGWAPLPPGCGWRSGVGLTWAGSGIGVGFGFGFSAANYCWTPTSYFSAQNCATFGTVGNQASSIFNNSQVINNYVVGNNNTIINGGIDPGQIQKHSRSEIRKVQLSDASSPTGSSSRMLSRPGSQAGQLAVYRPTVSQGSSAPRTVAGRSEVRPVSTAPGINSTMPDRSRLSSRSPISRTQPSTTARIEIPAGAGSPLGSPVKLLGRPGGQSAPSSLTNPRASIATPSANLAPSTRRQFQTRSTSFTGQADGSGASRLEPRKTQPSVSPNAGASGPARIPPAMNGNAVPSSVPMKSQARNPMAARQSTSAIRVQPSGARDATVGAPVNSTRSLNIPQSSRPASSTPSMSSGSRPQFSAGGGRSGSSGGSLSRPTARP